MSSPSCSTESAAAGQGRGDASRKKHHDPIAVLQHLVQVRGDEHDGRALGASLLELAPDIQRRFDVQTPGGVLQEDQGEGRPQQGKEHALLVTAGKRLHGVRWGPFDVVGADSIRGGVRGLAPVDEEASEILRQQKVLGQRQAGDEPLLQARGRQVCYSLFLVAVMRKTGDVALRQGDVTGHRPRKPRACGKEQGLPGAFHPGQADHLARMGLKADIAYLQACPFDGDPAQGKDRQPGGGGCPASEGDVLAEHHLDQALCLVRGLRGSHQGALAQDGNPGAEVLDVLQLVRDEDDRHSLGSELFQGRKQLFLLRLADTGCRLVQDEDPGARPEKAKDLELLAFPDGERIDVAVRVEAEIELRGKPTELPRGAAPVRKQAPLASKDEVVEQLHGRKVQGVLMQHSDAGPDGLRRRADLRRVPVQQDLPAVGKDEAREDLHQGALPRPVLSQDSLDRGRGDGQGDAGIGMDRAECLVDVAQFNQHAVLKNEGRDSACLAP